MIIYIFILINCKSDFQQAKPILNQGEIDQLVDPRLRGVYDVTQLKRLAFAGSLCIRASPTWRPTMSEVSINYRVMLHNYELHH